MAIGTISNPTTWVAGTIATAQWFQNAQDTLNLLYGGIAGRGFFVYNEDFMLSRPSTTANDQQFGSWATSPGGGTTTWSLIFPAQDDTHGVLQMAMAASSGMSNLSGAMNIGTGDFYYRARVSVGSRANLQTLASLGYQLFTLGGYYFLVGNNSVNWNVSIAGVTTDLTGATVTGAFQTLEMFRLSGVITVYIDGTLRHTVANVVNLTAAGTMLSSITTALGTATHLVDYVRIHAAKAFP